MLDGLLLLYRQIGCASKGRGKFEENMTVLRKRKGTFCLCTGPKTGENTLFDKKLLLWKALQINSFETISKKVQKNLKKGVDNP